MTFVQVARERQRRRCFAGKTREHRQLSRIGDGKTRKSQVVLGAGAGLCGPDPATRACGGGSSMAAALVVAAATGFRECWKQRRGSRNPSAPPRPQLRPYETSGTGSQGGEPGSTVGHQILSGVAWDAGNGCQVARILIGRAGSRFTSRQGL